MPTPNPTAYEQYSLELINRARLDPLGEVDALITNAASRVGVTSDISFHLQYLNVDIAMLRSQLAAFDPVAPVAWNAALGRAAESHSTLLAANNSQSHQEPGEASLGDRIRAEGYQPWRWSENVFSYGKDAVFTHAAFVIDWGYGAGGMQDGAGHRVAMLDSRVQEVGIGAVADTTGATGPWVVTQDFARTGSYAPQLIGVVINDTDRDDFYDIGEGMGGVTVTVTGAGGTWTTTTWDAGGYQLALGAGTYTVTFSGGGLGGTVTKALVFDGTQNMKLDAEKAEALVFPDGYMAGTAAAETLDGTSGDDAIFAGHGADVVRGGLGDDWVSGETYDATFDAQAAQVYRLYAATLGREPDQGGHLSWTGQLASGQTTLQDMAQSFVGSREFRGRFSADTAGDFVDLLYNNVLGRAGDAGGQAYWTGRIEAGALSRAEVVLKFAESAEHVAQTEAGALAFSRAGYQAEWADDVYRLYVATLGRDPDAVGLASWAEALAGGQSFDRVISGFVASAEFRGRFPGADADPDAFVDLLYNNVLGRAGDAGGQAYWTQQLVNGALDTAAVVAKFAQSPEFTAQSAEGFQTWSAASGGDRLTGGAGNNLLFGGIGSDTFVFAKADGGTQTVADLAAHDRVQLQGFGYASADEVLAHITADAEGSAVFADQGVRIVFTGVNPAELHTDQFLF